MANAESGHQSPQPGPGTPAPKHVDIMTTCIDHMVDMELVSLPGELIVVPTHLLYRAQDPLAVQLLFHDSIQGLIPWVFARDLLAAGTQAPSGTGDVRIWPNGTGTEAVLHLLLSSPHGSAHLTTSLSEIEQWLRSTYQLVPTAEETQALDLETHLTRFLNGTP
ncbi:sporulation and cell division protein SsgA [Streptomyces sp. BK340]|nr:sporulation and cell division protein SsgA [Streptomyces sp. BK340]